MIEAKMADGEVLRFPDGTDQAVIDRAVKQHLGLSASDDQVAPESVESSVARTPGIFAQGMSDAILDAIGAVPDLAAAGLRAINPTDHKIAPEDPRFYRKQIRRPLAALSEAIGPVPKSLQTTPETAAERVIYKGGRGAGDAASFFIPGAAVSNLAKGGTTLQRVGQPVAAQPVMQSGAGAVAGGVTEMTDNPWAGLGAALATPWVSNIGRRVVTPTTPPTGERARLIDAAKDAGIELTPGQVTGSKPLQNVESVLASLPFTAGRQGRIFDAQRKALNERIMATTGVRADDVTPETLNEVSKTLGKEFENLISLTNVRLDNKFFDEIEAVAKGYARRLKTDVKPVFQSYVDDIKEIKEDAYKLAKELRKNDPTVEGISLDGKLYQRISSDIRKQARKTDDPDLRDALGGIVRHLDNMMERSMGPDTAAAWRDLRNRYRNFTIIEDAARRGTQAERVAGDAPISGLRTSVVGADKKGYAKGRGDLNTLSRIGDLLGASRPSDSGTQMRQLIERILTAGPITGAGGALMLGVDPGTVAKMTAATYALPKAAQSIYSGKIPYTSFSPGASYITNRLLPQTPIPAGLLGTIAAEQMPPILDEEI